MHQHPRVPPRVSSPAASPQTNPTRTNNQREGGTPVPVPWRAGANASAKDNATSPTPDAPSAESIKKLDQIVQNFFSKVAVLVIDSRIKVKHVRGANGARKTSKWFQIETDDFEDFRDELKQWKTCGSLENTPPALIIEIYLDISKLKESQSLTIVDDEGKRWDVMDQLNSSGSLSESEASPHGRNTEVILERWTVELKVTGNRPSEDFNSILPTIYKKAIIFFRSIFTATRLLPAWKFASQSAARNAGVALIPRCRVRTSNTTAHGVDLLRDPIDGRPEPVTDYVFGDLDIPGGRLSTTVTYRNDCSFRVDDSEALLSSRFMGIDENFFKPSLTNRDQATTRQPYEVGSFRDRRPHSNLTNVHQTYGSLSTFHGERPLGTSPMTALRAVRAPGSDTSSPPESPPQVGIEPPSSMPTTSSRVPASRPGPSISFQPFKAGSLSGSPIPRQSDMGSPALPSSLTRANVPPSLTQPRNRTSLRAGMPASLRGPPQSTEQVSSSPRAGSSSRYSSSFTHRRSKTLTGIVSKAHEDDQGNSGRQSLPSSVIQPASGLLAETGASSDSLQPEDDNISEFLKVLDSKRTLKSFENTKRGESATNKTVAQLSKFHMMRDSHNALGDSMTSSVQMHRSSSSSSRQLTSVPGVTMSASSSLSKPQSPHTPHTPAIPSRLSENPVAGTTPNRARTSSRPSRPFEYIAPASSRESTVREAAVAAIDIPLSPRLNSYQRRSSSVAQESRTVMDDEADLPFAANRSLSLGAEEREPPTMSRLLGRQIEAEAAVAAAATDAIVATTTTGASPTSRSSVADQCPPLGLQHPAEAPTTDSASSIPRGSADDNPVYGFMPAIPSSSPYGRLRYAGMGAHHRQTPPQSSRGSFTGSGARFPRDDNESLSEEPLVFDFSEMDPQGRRSLEEGRGGGHSGTPRRGW